MIISASRRTDIPAFYTEWLMNRIRAGYCTVVNPFNRKQVSYVSLKPNDVDVIVFWTRNPTRLIPYLKEIDDLGLRYYFQYTILNYSRDLDTKGPSLNSALNTFKKLSDHIGPAKVIWRYDPIVFTKDIDVQFHINSYIKIAEELRGYTNRSVISVVDSYKKNIKRLHQLDSSFIPNAEKSDSHFDILMTSLVESATQNGMDIVSCAEDLDLTPYQIRRGKCVDDEYIFKVFGLKVTQKKDTSQRAVCGCVVSKDIGAYDTCLFECQYCYATTSFARARTNFADHDPKSPSLIGWYDAKPPATSRPTNIQLKLFGEERNETA